LCVEEGSPKVSGTDHNFDLQRRRSLHFPATLPTQTPSLYPLSTLYNTLDIMFRTALLRSARCAVQASARAQQPAVRRAIVTPFVTSRTSTPAFSISAVRSYASGSGLGQEEVTGRIMDLLKNFDKVRGMKTWMRMYGGACTDTFARRSTTFRRYDTTVYEGKKLV
jgi:hypothetical protein